MRKITVALALVAAVAVTGCRSRKSQTVKTETKAKTETVQLPDVFVAEVLDGTPTSIVDAKKSLTSGDAVLLRGRIMGTKTPFVDGRSVFLLGEFDALPPCSCNCPTPWDACCATPEEKNNAVVTIQVVDDQGKVLAKGLKGVKGLKEFSWVVVAGEVAPGSSAEAFMVNASSIYVEKS